MATRNIVPRATGEGQIGTSAKTWSAVYANDIAVTNGVTASTFTGDLTGDVTGDVTGNVTGDVTGDVTGSVTGATSVAFTTQGEVGFRGTTHTEPAEVCKQVIVTAGAVDSEWNDGNAKLALHTFDSTGVNTAENGGFDLLASDGTNSASLTGSPDGSLLWAGKTIDRINSSGTDYIRYENGLQICWGKTSNLSSANADVYTDITLPVAFTNTDYSVSLTTYIVSGGWNNHSFAVANKTTTSMRAQLRNLNSTAYVCYFMWIAIGKWK